MTPTEVQEFLSRGRRTAKVATVGAGGLDGEDIVFTTGGGARTPMPMPRSSGSPCVRGF